MNDPKPRIPVPRTGVDLAIDIVGLLLLAGVFVIAGMHAHDLPDRIPTHFNASGKPDAYRSRSTIWVLATVAGVVHAMLLGAAFIKPWYYNIPIKVTETNALSAYRITRRLLQAIRLETTVIFGMLLYLVIQVAMGRQEGIGAWVLPGILGTVLLTIVVFVALMVQVREKPSPTFE